MSCRLFIYSFLFISARCINKVNGFMSGRSFGITRSRLPNPARGTEKLVHLFSSVGSHSTTRLQLATKDEEEEQSSDREFAKVRRGRGKYYYDEDETDGFDNDALASQRSYASSRGKTSFNEDIDDEEYYSDDYDLSDDEDDDFLGDIAIDGPSMFENVVIPNPILDSSDPDGAADRFPELASDFRFWRDLLIVYVFIDLLSFLGKNGDFVI